MMLSLITSILHKGNESETENRANKETDSDLLNNYASFNQVEMVMGLVRTRW